MIGDAEAIIERIQAYIQAGCSKFVLLPIAGDDKDVLRQTRRLIDEVLPAF